MPTWGPDRADVYVFTYKEGMLATVAHDLKLRVARFNIHEDPVTLVVDATFDAQSMEVVAARVHGVDAPSVLSEDDKREIAKNLRDRVLCASRHPVIGATTVHHEGGQSIARVSVCGVTNNVALQREVVGDRRRVRATLHQPAFGIKPFAALLGTIKVRPDVDVEVWLPR